MTEIPRVAHPTLYGPAAEGGVRLFGLRCRRCARVSFPRQRYGCESCGAYGDDLLDLDLAPEGELVSFAVVHRHQGRDIQAPFVMAEVRLDSGPLLRCTLAQRHDAGLAIGNRVIGRLVDGASPDAPYELRFFAAGG